MHQLSIGHKADTRYYLKLRAFVIVVLVISKRFVDFLSHPNQGSTYQYFLYFLFSLQLHLNRNSNGSLSKFLSLRHFSMILQLQSLPQFVHFLWLRKVLGLLEQYLTAKPYHNQCRLH